MKLKFFLFLILISLHGHGKNCPNYSDAPLCPDSGATLLDETYPTQAFVISKSAIRKTPNSDKVTGNFITAILKSYQESSIPQIIVPMTSGNDFNKVIKQVRANLEKAGFSDKKIELALSQISRANSPAYTWQQDYFESFVDLKTGKPVLREFEYYGKNRPFTQNFTSSIAENGERCGIERGEDLKTQHKSYMNKIDDGSFSFGSGEMGGNVEGAPGGICLTGDNQSMEVAKSYCGKEENVLQLETSWLMVGHVDEIFKIIPSKFNDGRPSECQFSIMAASPMKGFQLMKESSNATKPFFSFNRNLNENEYASIIESRTDNFKANTTICNLIKNAQQKGKIPEQIYQENQKIIDKSVFFKILMNNAFAGAKIIGSSNTFKCDQYLEKISSSALHDEMINNERLLKLNKAIQESIDRDKLKIKEKILSRLPQCMKYYDELDAPNLFYGAEAIEIDGKLSLPKDRLYGGAVGSLFPNPTNSVLMNRNILLPESGSSVFDDFLTLELKKRNLGTISIDSWDYAHRGEGNIHCSSHSIPYCRPRN